MERHPLRSVVAILCCLLVAGCASLHREPLKVTVAGIEPVKGEGLEVRMALKLRVQNPNEAPVDYKGASVEMAHSASRSVRMSSFMLVAFHVSCVVCHARDI